MKARPTRESSKNVVMSLQQLLHEIVLCFILIIPIIGSVAFFTLAERKIMASIQRRKGPNIVGV